MGIMKTKMTKDIVPEGFTMMLALVDALPVIFFAGSMILIDWRHGKVLRKVIVVLKKKNAWLLFVQMRLFMPLGFLLMICSLFANADRISFDEILKACIRFPSIMCFVAGIAGMVLMTACALRLDSSDVKANWVEQLINGVAQGAFFLGILFMG